MMYAFGHRVIPFSPAANLPVTYRRLLLRNRQSHHLAVLFPSRGGCTSQLQKTELSLPFQKRAWRPYRSDLEVVFEEALAVRWFLRRLTPRAPRSNSSSAL